MVQERSRFIRWLISLVGAPSYLRVCALIWEDSFLNLEGAGAGGRATLFRSTDMEVTKWYKQCKRPFGTVVSGDGFKQGLVKSQTDYKVFTENLGMRGLDVAFWEPRSRYHTQDDDVKHSELHGLYRYCFGLISCSIEGISLAYARIFVRNLGSRHI
jgi:hypothetical protein